MTEFFIKRPVFTFVIMIVTVMIGIVSIINTPLKLLPDINPPVMTVVTTYNGAGSEEILEKITIPLEQSLGTLSELEDMQSTTRQGVSTIVLNFDWEVDLKEKELDIKSKMNSANLPDDANSELMKFDLNQIPIVQIVLEDKRGLDQESFKRINELQNEMLKIDGVAKVDSSKNGNQDVIIRLSQEKLTEYNLTFNTVKNMIKSNHVSFPVGEVDEENKSLTAQLSKQIDSVDELMDTYISKNLKTGEDIKLKDIADFEIVGETENVITRLNGKNSVMLSVTQQGDANTVDVSNQLQSELKDLLSESKYEDIEMTVLFDQGEFVQKSLDNVMKTIILGGLFAIFVLVLFLRNFRTPFVISVSIPFSLMVAFIAFYYAGFSLNIMTLGALALAIGMLVDNSIVVLENIYRHLSMGKDSKKAAIDGTKEIAGAIIASTLTTVAVFLPLSFATGMVKVLFNDFSYTVVFSLLASLFVSLTIVPALSSILLKYKKENKKTVKISFFEKITVKALKHRAITLILTFILLITSFVGLFLNGFEFIPSSDDGFVSMSIKKGSATEEEFKDSLIGVEEYFNEREEMRNFVVSYNDIDTTSVDLFGTLVSFQEREKSTPSYTSEYKEDLSEMYPDLEFNVLQNGGGATGGSGNTLSFTINNTDKNVLREDAELIQNELKDLKETVEYKVGNKKTVKEVKIDLDEEKLFEYGLSASQVGMLISDVRRGSQVITFNEDGNLLDVTIQMNEENSSLESLKSFPITTPKGETIKLEDISNIYKGESQSTIKRINRDEKVEVSITFEEDLTISEYSSLVLDKIDELELNKDTEVSFTGDQQQMNDSFSSLLLALVMSILLVYLVMAAQFESFKLPFIIMFSVPFVVIGVALGLTLTGIPLGVTVLIGFILLAGIVVNNAIVLIDYINQRKKTLDSTYDAIVETVRVRTRPILMTSLTTILGLLPLALGIGEGTEIQQPMAVAVIGGLISSTFLTLVVIPVIYSLLDKETRHLNKKNKLLDKYYLIPKENIKNEDIEKIQEFINSEEKKTDKPVRRYKKRTQYMNLDK